MTNMIMPEMRGLSDAEIDGVAGGNPWAFGAGVAVGAGLVLGAAAVAVGVAVYNEMNDGEEKDDEPKIAPGTDENGNPIPE